MINHSNEWNFDSHMGEVLAFLWIPDLSYVSTSALLYCNNLCQFDICCQPFPTWFCFEVYQYTV